MVTRQQVEGTIRNWYGGGQEFQSREVRKKLEIQGGDRDSIARLHNYLKAMEKEGLIQKVPSDQKRNQFYRLTQGIQASGQIDVAHKDIASKMPQASSNRPIDRLVRIEDTLLAIQQKLNSLDNKLDKALMDWL